MSNPTVYVFKGDHDSAGEIHKSLNSGQARFGWSYEKTANLIGLKQQIESSGWQSLTDDQQKCYQGFLLDVAVGDYVIYVNVPTWGLCTLARVTKPYFWEWKGGDFNHRLGVDPASVQTFDRNDKIVHPALSARLKLQGRWWRLYATNEFSQLLEQLHAGGGGTAKSPADNLDFLAAEVEKPLLEIARTIHHTHPNYSLEHFLAEVLRNVPGVKDVRRQGGAGDLGADIVMVIEQAHPLIGVKQTTCVAQVKSFKGEHDSTQAVEDIRRAFEAYPDAEVGLIFSTADQASPNFEAELEKLRRDTGKTVNLIIGSDLALFVIRYGSHLLTRAQPAASPAS